MSNVDITAWNNFLAFWRIELPFDGLKHLFFILLFHWMSLDCNNPFLEFLDSLYLYTVSVLPVCPVFIINEVLLIKEKVVPNYAYELIQFRELKVSQYVVWVEKCEINGRHCWSKLCLPNINFRCYKPDLEWSYIERERESWNYFNTLSLRPLISLYKLFDWIKFVFYRWILSSAITGIFQATLWVDISLSHLGSWISLLICEWLLWSYWCFEMVSLF